MKNTILLLLCIASFNIFAQTENEGTIPANSVLIFKIELLGIE